MTPSRFRWGMFLIAVGFFIIATNADWIDEYYWWELLTWWPLILIAVGIEKICQKTRFELISYATTVLLVGVMVLVAFAVGPDVDDDDRFSRGRWTEKIDPAVTMTEAVINHGNNDLRISRNRYDLVSCRYSRRVRSPRIDFEITDGVARLEVDRPFGRQNRLIYFDRGGMASDWQFSFAEGIPLKLTCRGDNSYVDLNLSEVALRELSVDNDHGDIFLRLGDANPTIKIDISGPRARFELRLPEGSGLKMSGQVELSYLEKFDLAEIGDVFVTDGYDSAAVTVSYTHLTLPTN